MARPKKAPANDPRIDAKLVEAANLAQRGGIEQAIQTVRRVLDKSPAHAEANRLISALLLMHNQPDRALFHAQRAVAAEKTHPISHLRLGVALASLNRNDEAIGSLETASSLDPANPEIWHALGSVAIDLGRYAEGEAALAKAAGMRPEWIDPTLALATCELNTARAKQAVERLRAIVNQHPEHLPAAGQLALSSSYDDSLSPEDVFRCHRVYGVCVERLMRAVQQHPNEPDPDRRIRLAFVSSELRKHSISYFLRPLLEHIDHEQFEVVMYHASRHEDDVTNAIKAHADRWVVCDSLTPPALAKRIHQDRIDVLVELSGHFARNRLPTLAARPAPVQITAIGYGNTTGIGTIDARIVDATTDPEPDADRLASERLVRLDRCFLAYRPDDDAPEPAAGEPGRAFTFGSFNDAKKIAPGVIKVWSDILSASPDARLLLKSGELGNEEMRSMLEARFAGHGIGADRLTLTGRIESERGHLALYDEIDLSLDTFPYAGTTTTCQSLWQGVPMLTLAGQTHAGRVGVSLLNACGQGEWIASDTAAYISKACDAYGAGVRTAEQRSALRSAVTDSPLLDTESFSLATQAAYRELWIQWCEKGRKA